MRASAFDEIAFFRAVQESGARALLIGRRALVLLGIPVLTAGYDFWIAGDDITRFNDACSPFGFAPAHAPHEAQRKGRYVLENDEHIDVLVAESVQTVDGQIVEFEQVWRNRKSIEVRRGLYIRLPTVEDLILTKQFVAHAQDLEDIRLLRLLDAEEEH